jgi:hypothetical protein
MQPMMVRVLRLLLLPLVSATMLLGCTSNDTSGLLAQQLRALEARTLARAKPLPSGDLRAEARLILARLEAGLDPHTGAKRRPPLGELGQPFAGVTLPATIRVWRRSKGGSSSCSGQVDVFPLEEYVKGVLPHEWIPSWEVESLRAGAIAIRSYASAWVAKGGKYTCADLCDTTYSQVYKDTRNAKASSAVDDTRGKVVVEAGKVVFAEYSAENSDPTKFGVSDPPCAGKTLFGHGRGMCQWGSQRWALQGKAHRWIAEHYYPNSQVVDTVAPDAGPPPPPDLGVDQALPPDLAIPDQAVKPDTAMAADQNVTVDRGATPDRGSTPDVLGPRPNPRYLNGGCGLSSAERRADLSMPWLPLSLLTLLGLVRIVRR